MVTLSLHLKRRLLPPALACAALLAAASPAVAGTAVPGDLAYGRPAVASTTDGPFPASRVVDADINTAWGSLSDQTAAQWLYVDLGASKSVDTVIVDWSYSYASEYLIQTSTD